MSVSNDVCLSCAQLIKTSHKQIFCKECKMFVHKKCTKLKQRELKNIINLQQKWICVNCQMNARLTNTGNDCSNDSENLNANVNVLDIDFEKYDKMSFNPLRYENMLKESKLSNEDYTDSCNIDCKYVTSEQLNKDISGDQADFTLLNLNIRSLNQNFDKLNQLLKSLDHNFTVIGLTETQLKDKPYGHLHLPDYDLEYVNRVGRNSGGVCMYIKCDI